MKWKTLRSSDLRIWLPKMFEVVSCCWSIFPRCPVVWCVHSPHNVFTVQGVLFFRSELWIETLWNLRRLPPWGVVGNLWRCRISVRYEFVKASAWDMSTASMQFRTPEIVRKSRNLRVFDVRTFCLICTHLSSVLNSMLNKSSLTFRTAADAQGDFPQGALSNVFVEGRALQ